MKQKVNCSKLSAEVPLLGLPHMVKAASETWLNPRVKYFNESTTERLTPC